MFDFWRYSWITYYLFTLQKWHNNCNIDAMNGNLHFEWNLYCILSEIYILPKKLENKCCLWTAFKQLWNTSIVDIVKEPFMNVCVILNTSVLDLSSWFKQLWIVSVVENTNECFSNDCLISERKLIRSLWTTFKQF